MARKKGGSGKSKNHAGNEKINSKNLYTKTGHKLTVKERKFIDFYIETGNARQSIIKAGYNDNYPDQRANALLNKGYISREIHDIQMEDHKTHMDRADELLEQLYKIAKGEVPDQFGFEASLSDRISATDKFLKRTKDIKDKLEGKSNISDNQVHIVLDFDRD